MRFFRKVKAIEVSRGGVAALRRTRENEDQRRDCGKGAFLQQVGGQFGELRSFSLRHRHMPAYLQILEPLHEISEAVARRVHVRVVYLVGIAGQDYLGPSPGAL